MKLLALSRNRLMKQDLRKQEVLFFFRLLFSVLV
jgi:hypothetical protein